jgi:DNA repair exonuclease SbcCD ATPase subunit
MPKRSSEDLDNDHTDELPVLLETVGLEEHVEPLFGERREDTSEHPALYVSADAASAEQLAELRDRTEQIDALEAQIRVLTDSNRDLERIVAEKDRRLDELGATLASLRRASDDSAGAEHRLATQLAIRDARLAELTASLERVEREAAAATAELERARGAAEAAQQDAETLRRDAAKARPAEAPKAETQDFREDYATLAAYVEGRRSWWEELQTTNARLAARAASLEHDLKAGAKRLAAAEDFAQRESNRAVALRAELVEYARRVDALEREQRLGTTSLAPVSSADAKPGPVPSADVAAHPPPADTVAAAAPSDPPPVLVDAVETVAPAVEALAQLEAEVEYKRQQVAAQLVELRDREQRLRDATSELGSLRTDLDESRGNIARLERTLADKDRALEARDARIATLHEELKQRAGAISLPALESSAGRASSHDIAADPASAPVLICLTGDAPRRFVLAKKTITVGRGPQCDLQILTHFVSREHARLTSHGGATVIEDLGSRNGVFVNSVRVDRRPLQQGDLVTIGETQFRFVESMAH